MSIALLGLLAILAWLLTQYCLRQYKRAKIRLEHIAEIKQWFDEHPNAESIPEHIGQLIILELPQFILSTKVTRMHKPDPTKQSSENHANQ